MNDIKFDLDLVAEFWEDVINKKYLTIPFTEQKMLIKYQSELKYVIENNLCKGRGMEAVLYYKRKIDNRLQELKKKADKNQTTMFDAAEA